MYVVNYEINFVDKIALDLGFFGISHSYQICGSEWKRREPRDLRAVISRCEPLTSWTRSGNSNGGIFIVPFFTMWCTGIS